MGFASDRLDRIAVEGPAAAGAAEGTPVRWSYRELDARVGAAAVTLRARGVTPGSRLAAVLPPGPEVVLLLHAVARLDATLVPLNPAWPEPEIVRSLEAVAPVAIIVREGEPSLVGGVAEHGERAAASGSGASRSSASSGAAPLGGTARGNAPAAILLTSGSSGAPRPVALSHGNLDASARGTIDRLGLTAEDRWFAVLSPAHVGGLALLHRVAAVGCTVVTRPRFDADETIALLDAGEFTHASLVPVMLARLVEARLRARGQEPLPRSLRCLLVGGAETPRPLLDRALALGYPIALTYGLTEATSQVATATPEEVRRHPGTVGRPLPGVEVRIRPDPDAGFAPYGGRDPEPTSGPEGEILVRGPTVAVGASRLPAAEMRDSPSPVQHAVGVDAEGWLHTGDRGRMEAEGFLYVTGRLSDRIVSGGVTVDPAEVEGVLLLHGGVFEVAVVGVPDPEWGERVVAAVVCAPGAVLGPSRTVQDQTNPDAFAAELLSFARERLGSGKRPREVRILETLPRNANGKVDRPALARAFLTGRGGVSSGP